MLVYDRQKKRYIKEIGYKEDTLKILYHTKIGRAILRIAVARPWFSKIVGVYKASIFSRHEIGPFVKKYRISTKGYDLHKMKSFNDFFIRKRRIQPDNIDKNDLVAIADARLSVYDIDENLVLHIKNSTYTVGEILGNEELAGKLHGGKCLVYRLAIEDYHRYHFPDDGFVKKRYPIRGELHTIRPISEKYRVFSRNCREVTVMETVHLGEVVQVEVGATLVGCIRNHNRGNVFKKLEEKGYFEYGGSTILLLVKKKIILDADIENCRRMRKECLVRIGERIGKIQGDEEAGED